MRNIVFALLSLVGIALVGCGSATSLLGGSSSGSTSTAPSAVTANQPGSADDASLASAVRAALQQDEELAAADVQVSSTQGVVSLSGSVPNALAYLRAIRVAREVSGVQGPPRADNLSYPGQ